MSHPPGNWCWPDGAGHPPPPPSDIRVRLGILKRGCGGRGVQWMRVVLYSKLVYNIT